MIDVGQGDALVIVSPDGFVLLLDSGTEGSAASIESYLGTIGVAGIDYTLVSHMDSDHVGGMDAVLANHPEVVASFDHGGSVSSTEYQEYANAAGSKRTTLEAGETIDLGPSVSVDVLHAHEGATSENDNSVVLRIQHGARTFLLGGDCEAGCEGALAPGPIDLYKVHHHGSNSSSTEPFLDRIGPTYTALISAGLNNPFGHPHQEVLDRLATRQIAVYGTYSSGHIPVISNGTAYTIDGQPVCTASDTRSCGTTDVGACSFGLRECADGFWSACAGAIDPVPEDCTNGVDDDCNGAIDDCANHVLIAQVAYDTLGEDALEEFVDLYNPSSADVSVGGWTLSDGAASWTIPSNTVIPARSYWSIAKSASGFAARYGTSPNSSGMSISLNNTGDVLRLVASDGSEVDYVAWEGHDPSWPIAAASGESIERSSPSADSDTVADWAVTSPATPRGGF